MVRLLFLTLALAVSATSKVTINFSNNVIRWGEKKIVWHEISTYNWAKRAAVYNNYAFVAIPRSPYSRSRITLARMNLNGNDSRQKPFPNLTMQKMGDCDALQNVVDIFVDRRGLLWALDSANAGGRCGSKIANFNATTGEVVRIIELSPYKQWSSDSTAQHIIVDYNSDGDFFVFVSDTKNRKILVISESCNSIFQLPGTSGVNSLGDITLNQVRSFNKTYLFINDEGQKRMFYVNLKDVELCSQIDKPPKDIGSTDGMVFLGNDYGRIIYFRSELSPSDIYKYDALDDSQTATVAYNGDSSLLATHVVADYASGRVFILESKLSLNKNNIPSMVEHSLTSIQ